MLKFTFVISCFTQDLVKDAGVGVRDDYERKEVHCDDTEEVVDGFVGTGREGIEGDALLELWVLGVTGHMEHNALQQIWIMMIQEELTEVVVEGFVGVRREGIEEYALLY